MLQETVLVDEASISLKTGQRAWWRFDVERGHRIKGVVSGTDNFEFAILDEGQFAQWHSGEETKGIFYGESKNAYAFEHVAKARDTWYACLWSGAWVSPVQVQLRIRRLIG
jgi:hypothetical protein